MDVTSDILGALRLRATAAQTVKAAFDRFLDQQINITRDTRSRASTSHLHLRDFLGGESGRDNAFPRVLSQQDDDFLGGSFARHSKNWPLDDIDIYFPLDGYDLIYFRGGVRAPYTLLSDDTLQRNPLLGAPNRWMEGTYISSRKLISEFAKVLNRHYPTETRVRGAGQAVNVKMADLGFDIVPSFSLRPDDRQAYHVYLIPDGNDGWIETNPRIDNQLSAELQEKNAKLFRPAVKLVKWWNTERCGGCFSSYYVELAIMRAFLRINQGGRHVSMLSDAVAIGFEALRDAAAVGNQSAWLPNGPAIQLGSVSKERLELLCAVAGCARDSATAEQSDNSEYALKVWKVIFGDKFPS